MVARNDGPCGRVVQAGESGFSIGGRLFCPSCFSAPNDGSISYTEGTVPVAGRCGQMLEPPPAAEPSPLDAPLEVSPLPQLDAQDSPLLDYVTYVDAVVAEEEVPLSYEDWQKAEALRRATAAVKTIDVEAESLAEVIDEGIRAIIGLIEAAYRLGLSDTEDDDDAPA